MSTEEAQAIVRESFVPLAEVIERHEQLYGPEWVGHFPGMPPLNSEGHLAYSKVMMTAFPHLERRIEDMVSDGDKVVVRWTAEGSQDGDFMGMPASGRSARSSGITIFRLANGRIVEEWSESDMLGLMQQLGVIPMPGGAG